MALKTLENFFKTTISTAWGTGTGNRYIAVLPTASTGRLVINPANSTKREIIEYSAKGTDGGGNYITVSVRGVGGTTDQTHDINEPVRSNITAEVITDIQTELDLKLDDTQLDTDGTLAANSDTKVASQKATKTYADLRLLKAGDTMTGALILNTSSPSTALQAASKGYVDGVAVSGAPNASTTVKGIVEIATDAEVEAGTNTGGTGATLVTTPSQISSPINQTLVAGENLTANDAIFVAKGDESRRINAYSTTRSSNEGFASTTWLYQSFTTSANTTSVTRIKLWGGSSGNPPSQSMTVRLRATPNGADMASGTSGFAGQNANGEMTIDIADTAVSPSTTYYLVMSVPSESFVSYYMSGSATSVYSGGASGISTNSGATWSVPSTVAGDFYFEVLEGDYVAGRAYKTVAATDFYAGTGLTANFIGFAQATVTSGNNVNVRCSGKKTSMSGLTPGTVYYLSNTPGAIATSAGTVSKKIGLALSATEILIKHDN